MPAARLGHALVWTGADVLVWGGGDCTRDAHAPLAADVFRWTPGGDAWARRPAPSGCGARVHAAAHWIGDALLVCGGANGSALLESGGVLTPD
jgi:hypothetical protein